MKKISSLILILVMCFTVTFGLSACDSNNQENDVPATTITTIENIEPWKADAASEEMKKYTKFFRISDLFDALSEYAEENPEYDPDNPLTEGFREFEKTIDNRMDTLINYFEAEKATHPFAQKYLEELNKTNYFELSDTDKFIFQSYAKLLLTDRLFFSGYILENSYFNVGSFNVNMIDDLVFASVSGTGEDIHLSLWFPATKPSLSNEYEFFYAISGKDCALDGTGGVKIPLVKEGETELDVEAVKKVINDNITFFEFLIEYRDSVYAKIRTNDEKDKASIIYPQHYRKWVSSSPGQGSFTNKFGTSTTKCIISGCSNYIASSGDTNCCKTHSNKCGNCNCYIDSDAMFCMSCMESYIKN